MVNRASALYPATCPICRGAPGLPITREFIWTVKKTVDFCFPSRECFDLTSDEDSECLRDVQSHFDDAAKESFKHLLANPVLAWTSHVGGPGVLMPDQHPNPSRFRFQQLQFLIAFYRAHFQPMILEAAAADPIAQCGSFNKHPAKCFEKYVKEFNEALRFLNITETRRKQLFLQGIPTNSIAFRDFLKPLVENTSYTFGEMVQHASTIVGAERYISHPHSAAKRRRIEFDG
jgi:hypothetical protein